MTTWDFIIALFDHVDEQMHAMPKHPEAHLWPSEVGTLGRLHALKGVGNRAFSRWLTRGSCPCRLRIMFRDLSRTVCVVSISRSSALETRFQPFFQASWPTSERTSTTTSCHDHQAAPFLRPSGAVATVARDRGAPL
jgi:hypothetical protein